VVEVWIMVASGLAGYVLRKLDFEVAPVVLGLVLAPMLEMSLRQSLAMSAGSYWILYDHPIARGMLAAAVVLLLLGLKPLLTRRADWRSRLGVGETDAP
jgi:putative tricarboxylic transport membrane protein